MGIWDHPGFIAAAALACALVAGWLFRAGNPKRNAAPFTCDLCGRRERGYSAREWRFCPYCGTPVKRQRPLF